MATPARNLIAENIAATLAGISIANGYRTEVARVERVAKDWASIGGPQMPWLGVAIGKERYTHQPGGDIRVELDVQVIGHVSAKTPAEASDKLSDLVDDIIAALNADTTRGGNAVSTTVVESETDESDPDARPDSRGGSGSVVVLVRVVYYRTTGAS